MKIMESRVNYSGKYESKRELHRKQEKNQCHAERAWRAMQGRGWKDTQVGASASFSLHHT